MIETDETYTAPKPIITSTTPKVSELIDAAKAHIPPIARGVVGSHVWALCADGYAFSIMAGRLSGTHPRDVVGPWEAVEVAILASRPIPSGEGWEHADGYLFGGVPLDAIDALIAEHGGLLRARSPYNDSSLIWEVSKP